MKKILSEIPAEIAEDENQVLLIWTIDLEDARNQLSTDEQTIYILKFCLSLGKNKQVLEKQGLILKTGQKTILL